jgi:hypothetical protein
VLFDDPDLLVAGCTSDYLARHPTSPLVATPATDVKDVAAWRELSDAAAVR